MPDALASAVRNVSACLLVIVLAAAVARGESWPGFRGPPADGLRADSLPVSWSPEENIRWRAPLPGEGQSSPVIWKNRVYVTSVVGPKKERCLVTALELDSGAPLWQHEVASAFPQEASNYLSKAAPTPVADADGVIAWFEGGNLVALDHDGNLRWKRNLVEEFGPLATRHGLGSSLIQSDEMAFVWVERSEAPYLLAVDKASGADRWKAPGLETTSWSTPVLLDVAGTQQLILSGSGLIRGVEISRGETLWNFTGVAGNSTPSPCVVGPGLMLIGATEGRGESDGGRPSDSNGLLRVAPGDKGFEVSFLWRSKRATSSFGSPIAHQGLAYFVNRTGILFCLDLETGEEVFAQRTPESVWATPLAIDDRIYLVGQKGTTTVIQAGRSFTVLAENRIAGEAMPARANPEFESGESDSAAAPPAGLNREASSEPGSGLIQYAVAAVNSRLLIRTGDLLYCLSVGPR